MLNYFIGFNILCCYCMVLKMINIEGREEKHGDDKTQCEPSLL